MQLPLALRVLVTPAKEVPLRDGVFSFQEESLVYERERVDGETAGLSGPVASSPHDMHNVIIADTSNTSVHRILPPSLSLKLH